MKPCEHLDYEGEYIECEVRTCAPHYPDVKYWLRLNPPYPEAATKVQFCKLRGRIPGVFQCWQPGEKHCYSPIGDPE